MSTELNLVLHEKQAAAYVGMSVSTLRRWRREQRGPRFVRIERTVLYRKLHLDEFLDQHTNNPDGPKTEQEGERNNNHV